LLYVVYIDFHTALKYKLRLPGVLLPWKSTTCQEGNAMSFSQESVISIESADGDLLLLRRHVQILQRNLKSAGISVTPHKEVGSAEPNDYEYKSDPSSLYALGIAFFSSGAAVALVKALSATFAATQCKNIKAKLKIGDKTIDITGEHLNGAEAEKLTGLLSRELEQLK
jgi:hypothetical protein